MRLSHFLLSLLSLLSPLGAFELRHSSRAVEDQIQHYFPTTWSDGKKYKMLRYLHKTETIFHQQSSLLETVEPQEDANPDSWGKAYALPFSGKSGAEAGGGSEPEVNAAWETNGENGGGSTNPEEKGCTKKTGMFLQGCVYVSNQNLKSNKLHECQNQVSSIGAECVFKVRGDWRL